MFLQAGNQGQATMEHATEKLEGMTVVESWIIEDEVHDKSRKYGLDMPVGTWMISIKCTNDEVWAKVKENKIRGFSIEGYFADRLSNRPLDKQVDQLTEDDKLLNKILDVLQESNTNTK
jgi:hypothetical protein